VRATFAATPDPRLREIMTAAVRHVHAFTRDVRLDTLERRAAVACCRAPSSTTRS
jgi:hydroxyquinol 1,2-dioxygenase